MEWGEDAGKRFNKAATLVHRAGYPLQAAHVQDEKKVSRLYCTDISGEHPGPRSRLDADITWDEETLGQTWNDGRVD